MAVEQMEGDRRKKVYRIIWSVDLGRVLMMYRRKR